MIVNNTAYQNISASVQLGRLHLFVCCRVFSEGFEKRREKRLLNENNTQSMQINATGSELVRQDQWRKRYTKINIVLSRS